MTSDHKPDPDRDGVNGDVTPSDGETLLSSGPDLIFEIGPDGRYIAWHGGPLDELYVAPEQFLDQHYSDVLPVQVARGFEKAFEITDADNPSTTFTYLLPVNQEIRRYEARIRYLSSGNRMVIIRNMTDKWRTKTALEQSEARYRTLVNNLPGVVYRCHIDENWSAIFVSEKIRELTGYPASDFTQRGRGLVDLIHPEDRLRVRRKVINAIESHRPFHVSYRMVTFEGKILRVAERGQAIYAEHDEIDYLDGVFFDITELHRMRQRLLVNSKMAAVGNLAAGVAHEINNPLAIAMANLEYLTEEMAAGEARDSDDSTPTIPHEEISTAVIKTQESIDRVRNIIDDLRTFSDAAEGRADRLNAERLLEWAIRSRATGQREDIELVVDLSPVAEVWASEVALVQVVWNLLDNAREAVSRRDDNNAKIELSLYESNDHVCFEVHDNGPGMSPEVTDRVFEPFFTTKSVGEGAGLGLFVCRGLINGMDGTIEIDSHPGQGTTVKVCLPKFEPIYPAQAE